MNNNKKKRTLKQLKAAMICGAFFVLLGLSIHMLIAETGAHAAYLTTTETTTVADPTLGSDDPTAAPTSILPPILPTPTPVPTQVPTPVPTKAPKPTVTPPKPTRVPVQPTMPVFQPTPTIGIGGIIPPDDIPTITATSPTKPKTTPTATSTSTAATPTAVPAAGSSNTTTPTDDPTPKAAGGMNPVVKSIAIGAAIAIVASILLSIFFLKRPKNNKPLPFSTFSQSLAQTAQPTPWLNQSNANAAFVMPGGDRLGLANEQAQTVAGANSMMPTSNTPPPSAFTNRAIPMPSSTQKRPAVAAPSDPVLTSEMAQAAIDAQPYLKSSNPRPMPAPFGAAYPQKNPVSTSDMNPFPLDNLDLSNMRPQTNRRNDSLWDTPTVSNSKNPQPISPISAPSIQDDPILETIMRQAQMGIYAIADKSPSDPNDDINDAFLA